MNVLLINPPLKIRSRSGYFKDIVGNLFYNSSPLGLCYLAAVLEKKGVSARIIDAPAERLDYSLIIEKIKVFRPDVVGITATTVNFFSAVELAREVRRSFPGVFLVIGGPHCTAAPGHALSFGCFDTAVIGEGELTFSELVDSLIRGGNWRAVDGLAFENDGRIEFSRPRAFIEDLDTLPMPARHLLKLELYKPQFNDEYILPKTTMVTSRGCPYECIFCEKTVFGASYRSFSARYIVSEMEWLVSELGVKDIAFVDSLFMVSHKRVSEITDEIVRRKVDVRWTCTVRANVASYDLLKKMKDAGCWRVRIGIESGDDDVLKFIRKGITTGQVRQAVSWAASLGLQPKGFFMLGHLVDTRQTIERTISFAKSLPLKDITVQINTPMVNTYQYRVMEKYGELLTKEYDEFSYWEPVFVPAGLSRDYLLDRFSYFYRSFYLRPAVIWRHLLEIRRWYNIARYARASMLIAHLFFSSFFRSKNEPVGKNPEVQ